MKFTPLNLYLFLYQSVWILPFVAFIVGYICLQFFITDTIVQTPNLIGKDILQAIKISSNYKLNIRITDETEVPDALPGTIIKQNPLPGKSIKAHQSIFIVITKSPAPIFAPELMGLKSDVCDAICKNFGLKNKIHYLPSADQKGQCIGQFPSPGQQLDSKNINTYISTGNETQYIFPDFTGIMLKDVLQFLQPYGIEPEYLEVPKNHPYKKTSLTSAHNNENSIVVNQKPLAGTFVTPNNKLHVYLEIASTPK